MLNDDTDQRLYNVYAADCLGMLVRQIYGSSDFKLYSEFMRKKPEVTETKEQVIDKILRLLDGAGKGVV